MESFPILKGQNCESLDGLWDFAFISRPVAPSLLSLSLEDVIYDSHQFVPGVFDATIPLAGKRGLGIYRRKFTLAHAGRHRLICGGFLLAARILVDGIDKGVSRLPYSGQTFEFEATAGEHEIVIVTDNRIESTPLWRDYYDFYAYGGILRSIHVADAAEDFPERCAVFPIGLDGKVEVRFSFGSSQADGEFAFEYAFDGGEFCPVSLRVCNSTASFEATVPDAAVWSPESPNLHRFHLRSGERELVERFGIRTIGAHDGKIFLNGKEIRLKGFNRHESHPDFGPALPCQTMLQDLKILRDMGCNFIRGSHYPQSQEFLDLCDSLGFLVWEESLAWGNQKEQISEREFFDAQLEQTAKMVKNSCNHPSVIIFGFMNECASDCPQARPLICALADKVRTLDPSRLVSFASNRLTDDLCLEFADVISFNIYPAWYGLGPDEPYEFHRIRECIEGYMEFLGREENRDKPFIISEIGAAALYGCHDRLGSEWSEEYQAEHLKRVCEVFAENKRISGLAIWLFADSRTYVCGQSRPRGFNNKGSLDEYRRPKRAYDEVKAAFRKI